jgi:hypothetical protein
MAFFLHPFIRQYYIEDIDVHIYTVGELEISPFSKIIIFLLFMNNPLQAHSVNSKNMKNVNKHYFIFFY